MTLEEVAAELKGEANDQKLWAEWWGEPVTFPASTDDLRSAASDHVCWYTHVDIEEREVVAGVGITLRGMAMVRLVHDFQAPVTLYGLTLYYGDSVKTLISATPFDEPKTLKNKNQVLTQPITIALLDAQEVNV